MHKLFKIILISLVFLSGCAPVTETFKKIWGSSTQTLEEERFNAISKIYYCSFDECFDAVLSLALNEDLEEPLTEKYYEVFLKNRLKGHVVVMGIPGQIKTTEVGIFLDRISKRSYQIDISSLSTTAKRKVAEKLFEELDLNFEERL